ncbi:MAG: RadC family protein [Lentisphaeria bacterium]|nr:RadC family protein [Lentisphaeria bacterium]
MTPEDRFGHRQRLREKFEKHEQDAFLDYELLELILTYSIPRRDVKPIAKELMNRFHTFPGVMDASPEDLAQVPGLGQNSVTLLKLIRCANVRYLARTMESLPLLDSPRIFADYARMRLGDKNNEVTLIFYLNTQNRLIRCDAPGSGSVDAVSIYPSEVAKTALLCGARSVVLCHNHPGGNFMPSRDDDAITFSICKALTALGLVLLDHVIVSRFGFYSYREHEHERGRTNLLSKLEGDCT